MSHLQFSRRHWVQSIRSHAPPTRGPPCAWSFALPCIFSTGLEITKRFSTSRLREGGKPRSHWTAAEDKILLDQRLKKQPIDQICKLLPNRTKPGIKKRWFKVCPRDSHGASILLDPSGKYWTLQEMQKCWELRRAGMAFQSIANHIPTRTPHQLMHKYSLDLKHRDSLKIVRVPRSTWTVADEQRLLDYGNVQPPKSWMEIGRELGRTTPSVKSKYHKLIRQRRGHVSTRESGWTKEEEAALTRLVNSGAKPNAIQAALPGRTLLSIKGKRVQMSHLLDSAKAVKARRQEELGVLRETGASWEQIQEKFPSLRISTLKRYYRKWARRQNLSSTRIARTKS